MRRTFLFAALMGVTIHHGHCEDVAKAPAFEVASITPCKPGTPEPPGEHAGMADFISPGGRFRAAATTVKFLMEWAYGIQPSQHSGGPSWVETDRFDFVAKAEGSPSVDQMKLMTRTLLEERFKLKLHHETKKTSVYVIGVGKTPPKLFPPKDGEQHTLHGTPKMDADHKAAGFHLVATRFSIQQLIDTFARQLGRVMVNETGLNGEYDFSMDLIPDENSTNVMEPSILMAAMREQLGLTLKSQEASVDFLVIDSAEKVVAGN
jgi:uncharacterized protein (TIGR03435 family)